MDEESFGMICWGVHSQHWKTPLEILSQVKHTAITKERLWLLLEDGSLHNGLALGERKSGKITNEVVDIFTGGKQVFTLDKDGQMYEWDRGITLQDKSDKTPVPLPLPSKKSVVQVACGKSHMLILTKYCEIYSKGDNSHGQLGLDKSLTTVTKPKTVSFFKGLPISQIAAGDWSSFCVTISGRAFAWGQNEFGQLGLKIRKTKKIFTPQLLAFSTKNAVAFISAGEHHTALLTKGGGLFMCGRNTYGQLGNLDTSIKQSTPWRVQELKDSVVTQVACGQNHTVAYVPGCGQVFGFGDNSEGQLGVPKGQKLISAPAMLTGPWGNDRRTKVIKVNARQNSTLILYSTSDKEGLEVDDRLIPQHRQITKIDQNLCDKIAQLDEDSAQEELNFLFRAQSCVNASFCADDKNPMTKDFLGINFPMARRILSKLCNSPETCDAIVLSLDKGIVQNLPNHSEDIEALKAYIILPIVVKSILEVCEYSIEIHCHCQDDVLLCFVEKALGPYKKELKELMMLVDKEYIVMLISLYKDLIVQVLFGSLKLKLEESRLCYPVEMLEMLFDINTERKIVNYKEFAITDLPQNLLCLHYDRWKGSVKANWNFCQFPFLLEAKAKTALLEIDSKVRRRQNLSKRLVLEVERKDLLGSVTKLEQLRDIQRPLQVQFAGERGVDDGALRKEYFMLIFEEILNSDNNYGLFDENETSHLLWFPRNEDDNLHLYTFVGKLCGMALYNGIIVNFNMPLAMYKELFGEKPNLDDFIEIDPSIGNSLKQILDFTEEDDLTVEDVFGLYFTVPGLDEIPLIEGGEDIPVTGKNRQEYIDHYLEYFFHKSVQSKLDAFRTGFFQACAKNMLALFRPEELMEMVTGIEDYDWEILKDTTKYEPINCFHGGFDELHPVVKWFWEVLLSMSKEDKNKFLIFLTGSNKIPITGLHITIKQRLECDDFLPTAEVCYNALHLHTYSSKEILEERLRLSILCKGYHII